MNGPFDKPALSEVEGLRANGEKGHFRTNDIGKKSPCIPLLQRGSRRRACEAFNLPSVIQ